MKAYLVAAAAISAVLAASPALAAKICDISIKSPTAGAAVSVGLPPMFRWTSEPPGTDTRTVTVSGAEDTSATATRYRLHWAKMLPKGDYSWFVTFTDKDGKIICRTPAVHFSVTEPKPGHDTDAIFNEAANRNFAPTGISGYPPAAIVVSYFLHDGRLVVVLKGSSYGGQYWKLVDGNNYDGSAENLAAALAIGLEIHDNTGTNIIIGGPGSDLIYSTGGNDDINPGPGKDTVDISNISGHVVDRLDDGEPDHEIVHTTGFTGTLTTVSSGGDLTSFVP